MIINYITQYNNKVLGDYSKKSIEFHRLDRSMEKSVSTFQSLVAAQQQHFLPQQKLPLAENENPDIRSNQEQGMDKDINRWKVVESQPISVGF